MTSPEDDFLPKEAGDTTVPSKNENVEMTQLSDSDNPLIKARDKGIIGNTTAWEAHNLQQGNIRKVLRQRRHEKLAKEEPPIDTSINPNTEHVRPMPPVNPKPEEK